jgi:hypothetical protein
MFFIIERLRAQPFELRSAPARAETRPAASLLRIGAAVAPLVSFCARQYISYTNRE